MRKKQTYYLDDKSEWALDHGGHIDKGIRDDDGALMALPDLIPAEDIDEYDDEHETVSQKSSGNGVFIGLATVAGIAAIGAMVAHVFSKKEETSQTQQTIENEQCAHEELRKAERSRMRQKMKRKIAEKTAQLEHEKLLMETDRRIAAERREQQAWEQVADQRNLTNKILDQHEAQRQRDHQMQEQLVQMLEHEQELLLRQQEQLLQQMQMLQNIMKTGTTDQSTTNIVQIQIRSLALSMENINSRIRENYDKSQIAHRHLLELEQGTEQALPQIPILSQGIASNINTQQAQVLFARAQAVERGER